MYIVSLTDTGSILPPTFSRSDCAESIHLSIDGWHGELHVAMGDVSLAVVEAAATKELLADSRESSVTADDQVDLDLILGSI